MNVPQSDIKDFCWNLSIIECAGTPLYEKAREIFLDNSIEGIPLRRMIDTDIEFTDPIFFRSGGGKNYLTSTGKTKVPFIQSAPHKMFRRLELDKGYVSYKPIKDVKAVDYGGNVLIPQAIRFNKVPLIATLYDQNEKIISTRVYMIRASSRKAEKALTVWLNSIFGIIQAILLSTTVEGSFGHIYSSHIRNILLPDLSDSALVEELTRIYDKYKSVPWESLPKQLDNAINGRSKRLEYDIEVVKALINAYNRRHPEKRITIDQQEIRKELLEIYRGIRELI